MKSEKDSVWTLPLEGRLDLQEKSCKCCQICKHSHLKLLPLKQTSLHTLSSAGPCWTSVKRAYYTFSIHLFTFLLLFKLMNLKMSPCYVLVYPWTLSKWCQSALKGSKREATPYLLKNPNKSDNYHLWQESPQRGLRKFYWTSPMWKPGVMVFRCILGVNDYIKFEDQTSHSHSKAGCVLMYLEYNYTSSTYSEI